MSETLTKLQEHDFFRLCVESNKNTPLILHALEKGKIGIYSSYLKYNLLQIASANGRLELVRALIRMGSDVNEHSMHKGLTALHLASAKGKREMICELLSHKADPNLADSYGYTPLHSALMANRVAATEILLNAGAKEQQKASDGVTPVELAARSKYCGILLQMSCKQKLYAFASFTITTFKAEIYNPETSVRIQTVDEKGDSLLMLAVRNALEETPIRVIGVTKWHRFITELLDLKANPRHINKNRESVFTLMEQATESHFKLQQVLYESVTQDNVADLSKLHISYLSKNIIKCIKESQVKTILLQLNGLETIPGDLVTLSVDIKTKGNPLSKIPRELHGSWQKLQKYLLAIKGRAELWDHRKLLFVGQVGAGKSSLLQHFLRKKVKLMEKEECLKIYPDISFQGIKDKIATTIRMAAWDFGREQILSSTHHIFISSHCIYMVLFNVLSIDYTQIEYWLRNLKVLCHDQTRNFSSSSVYLVGSHGDELSDTQNKEIIEHLKQKYRKSVYNNLADILIISSKTGRGINVLKDHLFNKLPQLTKPVPSGWVHLKDLVDNHRTKAKWVGWATFKEWARNCNIGEREVIEAARFLSDHEEILFYDDPDNAPKILILDAEWLSEGISKVFSPSNENLNNAGKLTKAQVSILLKLSFPSPIHSTLTNMLQQFHIMYRIPSETITFLIPSILSLRIPNSKLIPLWKPLCPISRFEMKRIIRYPFIPNGYFDQVIAHISLLPSLVVSVVWRGGILLSLHTKSKFPPMAKIIFDAHSQEVNVHVRYERDDFTILALATLLLRYILDGLSTFIEGYNMQSIERFAVCSHCITNNSASPYLFPFVTLIHAFKSKQAIVFCENITSPSRCVLVSDMVPDITMEDFQEIILEDLTVGSKLGSGAFGTVYAGKLKLKDGTETSVAVKELLLKKSTSNATETLFLDFQKEVFVMNRLHHPNIVRLFGVTKSPLRMVLELVCTGDLMELLHPQISENEKGRISKEDLPWRLRLLIALDMAKGMRHLAQQSPPIIHRDVRSPNIFLHSLSLDPKEVRAKVADFGLSRSSGIGLRGALATWQWLAPEVLEGNERKSYNECSDIYSFGICCWELASRDFPFEEFATNKLYATDNGIINPHLIKKAIIKQDLRPSMPGEEEGSPPAFDELIQKCFRKDPAQRPSFSDIIILLLDILDLKEEDTEWNSSQVPLTIRKRQRSAPKEISAQQFHEVFGTPKQIHIEDIKTHKITCFTISSGILSIGYANGSFGFSAIGTVHSIFRYQGNLKQISSVVYIPHLPYTFWFVDKQGRVEVWEVPDGKIEKGIQLFSFFAFGSPIEESFGNTCYDITMKVIGSGDERCSVWMCASPARALKIFAMDGSLVKEIEFPTIINGLVLNDGLVWIATGNSIHMFHGESLDFVGQWNAHDQEITAIYRTGDNVWTSDFGGVIHMWHGDGLDIRKEKTSFVHSGYCVRQLNGNEVFVVSIAIRTLIVWDACKLVPLQEVILPHQIIRRGIAFCDSNLLLGTSSSIHLWQQNVTHVDSSKNSFIKGVVGVRGNDGKEMRRRFSARISSTNSVVAKKKARPPLQRQRSTALTGQNLKKLAAMQRYAKNDLSSTPRMPPNRASTTSSMWNAPREKPKATRTKIILDRSSTNSCIEFDQNKPIP